MAKNYLGHDHLTAGGKVSNIPPTNTGRQETHFRVLVVCNKIEPSEHLLNIVSNLIQRQCLSYNYHRFVDYVALNT